MAEDMVKARLRLWRVQTMALTALVPVVGALVFLGEPSTWTTVDASEVLPELILLFLVGCLFHIYGFVLNEWSDIEVDRASSDLQEKPLVSGMVSLGEAKWTAIGAGLATFPILALVTLDPPTHMILLGALAMAAAYDLWGKRFPLDVLLAGSLTLLLLTGAMALGGFDPNYAPHVTLLLCVGGLQFLQNLYQNAIEGGLKDADHDAAAGARTFAAVLGVRVRDDGELVGGAVFTWSALLIKAAQISLLLYTAVEVTDLSSQGQSSVLWTLLLLTIAGMIVTTGLMLPPVRFERGRLKRLFSVHELFTFAAIITVVTPLIGEWGALGLFLLPMVWFMAVNRLLFGGSLEPGV
jgi:4-hydroxybenzoate polyprenyltransferase